jgi:hypothetical protein
LGKWWNYEYSKIWFRRSRYANSSFSFAASAAPQTAGLCFGGAPNPSTVTNATEEYDGSTWTVGGTLVTARELIEGAGTQTAGLGFSGNIPPTTGATEHYDGTSWTSVPGVLNTIKVRMGSAGTQIAAIKFGGESPNTGATELYDGTSWTSSPASMATARNNLAGAGTQSAALGFGGEPATGATEEWTGAGPVTQTITAS